ncbi:MAG TPA: VOC family protein [Steroidobacteraceae bacterium]|nr:VOC family protein [Steroidobacteraceae bacterium]
MSHYKKYAVTGCVAMTLALGLSATSAHAACATVDAPPTAMVPAGDVLRAGHLGREIGDTQPLIHFYSDLIGLELIGARTAPRPFFMAKGLQVFAELGEDDDVYKSSSRVALLPIPGTAATAGAADKMTIEAIEIKGVKSAPYHPALNDPGASYLKLEVRDLDKTLALLKGEWAPIITAGGAPVELSGWPGMTGSIRAVMVKDTDGYPVELVQVTPAPASTAPADSKVLGTRVAVVVDNLEASCKFYQDLAGSELKFWVSPLMGTQADAKLTDVPGQFRIAQAMVPGSPVVLELIEYQNHNHHFKRGFIQDPGTAHFLFMVKDTDTIVERVHAMQAHTLSRANDATFISPTVRSMFVPDPQGFWLEFMDHDVKRDPNAK